MRKRGAGPGNKANLPGGAGGDAQRITGRSAGAGSFAQRRGGQAALHATQVLGDGLGGAVSGAQLECEIRQRAAFVERDSLIILR